MDKFIVNLNSNSNNTLSLEGIGGKGKSLCKLITATTTSSSSNNFMFNVPNGFIINSSALHASIQYSKKENSKQLLLEPTFKSQLEEAITNLTGTFNDENSSNNQGLVAVRSSSEEEDGAEASLAGMFETYLNVKCEYSYVSSNVIRCWLSSLSARAQLYRTELLNNKTATINKNDIENNNNSNNGKTEVNNNDNDNNSNEQSSTNGATLLTKELTEQEFDQLLSIKFAVVVQKMVIAKCAGVCFTKDPITGNDVITIEAIIGLGEDLVSGKVTPDNYKYKRPNYNDNNDSNDSNNSSNNNSTTDDFELISERLVSNEIDSDGNKIAILHKDIRNQLCKIALNVEKEFNNVPQDIEFAFDGKTIWLLQARPITTIFNADNSSTSTSSTKNPFPTDLLVNNVTREVFQSPLTQITWSAFSDVINRGLQLRYKNIGIDYLQLCNGSSGKSNNRRFYELRGCNLYQNLTITDKLSRLEFGVDFSQTVKQQFSDVPLALFKQCCDTNSIAFTKKIGSTFSLLFYLQKAGTANASVANVLKQSRIRTSKIEEDLHTNKRTFYKSSKSKQVDGKQSDFEFVQSLWSHFKSVQDEFATFASVYIDANVYLHIFAGAISKIIDKPIDTLLTGLGDVITAEMNDDLLQLSQFAIENDSCHRFFFALAMNKNYPISTWKEEICCKLLVEKIELFLQKFGYRAIDELEVSSVRWREDPTYILQVIATHVHAAKSQSNKKQENINSKAEVEVDDNNSNNKLLLANNSSQLTSDRKKAIATILQSCYFYQRPLVRWAINQLIDFTRHRENLKDVVVRFIAAQRSVLLQIAEYFTVNKVLTDSNHIFNLSIEDIQQYFDASLNKNSSVPVHIAIKTEAVNTDNGSFCMDNPIIEDEDEQSACEVSNSDSNQLRINNYLQSIIKANLQQYQRASRIIQPPSIFVGDKPHFPVFEQSETEKYIELKGNSGAPGLVSGVACVIRSPTEASKILECQQMCDDNSTTNSTVKTTEGMNLQAKQKQNVILITRATDPGWTPLFLLVQGVVVESGGTLSHSAIVAREFGIPCVLSVMNLLGTVKHGDKLTIDGSAGVVRIMK